MKTFLLSALVGCFLLTIAHAQSGGAKISGHITGLKDTTCVLAHYYGSTQYIPKDTARVDGSGNFVFATSDKLPEGLYIAVAPKNRYIELILDSDQEFSFSTDTANVIQHMKVTGSKENELFYTYQQQLGKLYEGVQAMNTQKTLDAAARTKQMSDLQQQAQTYRTQFLKDNTGTFAVKLLKATAEPEVPAAPKAANGRPDSVWVFNYFKKHFWDDFDFSDERFIRSPVLQRKLERYVKELTVQQPDSLIKEADFLVGRAKAGKNKEIKSYIIWYLTSQYERPTVMGTDGLYVHMFEKYYATGEMEISDPSVLKQIGERVATLKPTLVGKMMVPPAVSDTLGRPVSLANLKADYTVVYFFDPHCGHCRESAPKLKKFVDDYKGKGVEVVAVATAQTPEEWKKFIREFKMGKAINGYDYTAKTNYQKQYDVWTTPTVYILDKNKKILARKLPVEQIEDFILFQKRQQASATAKASVKK